MNSSTDAKKLLEQGEVIRKELVHNRMVIANKMGNSDDVFPRSIAMQLITTQKMSDIIPLYNMALAGLRIFKYVSPHSKTHKPVPK
jgi:hypothetical protein